MNTQYRIQCEMLNIRILKLTIELFHIIYIFNHISSIAKRKIHTTDNNYRE